MVSGMTRAEKRAAILAALREDESTSDRAIATAVGADHKTVAAVRRTMKTSGEIETPHHGREIPHDRDDGEIRCAETPRMGKLRASGEIRSNGGEICPVCAEIEFLHDPRKRTVNAVVDWLLRMLPNTPVNRICAALQRRKAPSPQRHPPNPLDMALRIMRKTNWRRPYEESIDELAVSYDIPAEDIVRLIIEHHKGEMRWGRGSKFLCAADGRASFRSWLRKRVHQSGQVPA
jgi:hypothetical protein